MKPIARTLVFLAPIAALTLATAAQAAQSTTRAAVDVMLDTDTNTTGGLSESSMTSGISTAQAMADLFSVRVIGVDNGQHFAPGRPEAAANSDFFFEVEGATGPIELTFNFEVTGAFLLPDSNFSTTGGFSALLRSASDDSPYVDGSLNIVQHSCCGRTGSGRIRTYDNYFDTGDFTSVVWEGANPGNFSLTTSFLAATADAGRLTLAVDGAGGSVDFDFGLRLASITTTSTVQGLSIFNTETDQRFAITSAPISGAIPEPSTWAMMILGFGLAGGMVRTRSRRLAG
ncbi:MAG: PEPxxWA-CTERM sorting domain-containing protein [Phenylobacterium sp.]|nr:PEPxxWA-CTERM sorting domain-containing protein [Phenylobacterium sp.]